MAEPDTPEDVVYYNKPNWHFTKGLEIFGDFQVNGDLLLTRDDLLTTSLPDGINAYPRSGVVSNNLASTSQVLNLTYFRSPKSFTASIIKYYTSGTAAGATPTLVKYALFTVAANGDLTRVGITPNDTALLNAINSPFPKAMTAPVVITAGVAMAVGILVVTAFAAPLIAATGGSLASAVITSRAPRIQGQITAQADIAASYAAASVIDVQNRMFAEVLV